MKKDDPRPSETMAERIQRLRKAAGYSQNTLAKRLGITRNAIIKWEQGESTPSRRLAELAVLLGTTSDYLLTGKDELDAPQEAPELPDELRISPKEWDMLEMYRALNSSKRQVIDTLLQTLTAPKSEDAAIS